ncbi:MAG: Mov34/MPN/PAD-1 family protein [Planctomycetes bacterium]|nr:Mov34/MPN/PAD-1 family protein [Planctomycetota bacterium]
MGPVRQQRGASVGLEQVQRALRAAREAAPDEACGLLLRTPTGIAVEPRGVGTRTGFHIPARELAAEAARGELLGVWHSHPVGPPDLSPEDLNGLWEGALALVVGLQWPSAALYRLEAGTPRLLSLWTRAVLADS